MSKQLVFSLSIKDCKVETFRAGGNGGQNQNKRDTGVRVKHLPSGAVAESREERSQLQNKKRAFRRMAETKRFQTWARARALQLPTVEEAVEAQMQPENLKIEIFAPGS